MRIPAIVFVGLLLGDMAVAGPWNREKGTLYFNVSYELLSTTELATPDGVVQTVPRFRLQQGGVYAAYGLTDSVTLLADRLGFRTATIADFDSASGLEDVRVGAQWQLPSSGRVVMAVRGVVQAPSGDPNKGLGLLPTGSGTWEGDVRFSIGSSSSGGRVYGYGEIGHNMRGSGLRDGLSYEAQLGVRASDRIWIQFNLRGLEPYSSTPGEGALTSPAGLGDGVSYTALGPALTLELGENWGVQMEIEDAVHATNLAVGPKFRFKWFLDY